jgi:hypothetical protein
MTANKAWKPIGSDGTIAFHGIFNGNNKTISGLWLNRSSQNFVGLFGYVTRNESRIFDLNLVLAEKGVFGMLHCGGLVGELHNASVENCSMKGIVKASMVNCGGLVGYASLARFENCFVEGNVNSRSGVGGFIGMYGDDISFENCFSTAGVVGSTKVGGFAGDHNYGSGTFTNCFAMGKVEGGSSVGGFAGVSQNSEFTNCYTTSSVEGEESVGGFIGEAGDGTEITYCYSAGEVTGDSDIGGFAGTREYGVKISNCYFDEERAAGLDAIGYDGDGDDTGITGKVTKYMVSDAFPNDLGNSTFVYRMQGIAFGEKYNFYPQLTVFAPSDATPEIEWTKKEEWSVRSVLSPLKSIITHIITNKNTKVRILKK